MNQNIEPTSEVEWIEIQVPVFTGEVSERTPDFIDGDCCDFLTTTQRAAINRLHRADAIINGNPARTLPADGLVARALFATIGRAFEKHQAEGTA